VSIDFVISIVCGFLDSQATASMRARSSWINSLESYLMLSIAILIEVAKFVTIS
jgi:hypothetical protein